MKVLIIGLIMISIFLNGCGRQPDTDVSSEAKYRFSSFAGTAWKTKVTIALGDIKRHNNEQAMTLVPPKFFDPMHPKFTPLPNMRMISVLPVGTRLRIERLMKDNGIVGDLRATASLEDGKVVYIDALLAKNRFLDPGDSDSKEWGVDPDMLEKAD